MRAPRLLALAAAIALLSSGARALQETEEAAPPGAPLATSVAAAAAASGAAGGALRNADPLRAWMAQLRLHIGAEAQAAAPPPATDPAAAARKPQPQPLLQQPTPVMTLGSLECWGMRLGRMRAAEYAPSNIRFGLSGMDAVCSTRWGHSAAQSTRG